MRVIRVASHTVSIYEDLFIYADDFLSKGHLHVPIWAGRCGVVGLMDTVRREWCCAVVGSAHQRVCRLLLIDRTDDGDDQLRRTERPQAMTTPPAATAAAAESSHIRS